MKKWLIKLLERILLKIGRLVIITDRTGYEVGDCIYYEGKNRFIVNVEENVVTVM